MTLTVDPGYTEHFQPYVVCVDTASVPGYHVAIGNTVANPAGSSVAQDAYCKSGEIAVGGGAWRHSPDQFLRTSVPTTIRRAGRR